MREGVAAAGVPCHQVSNTKPPGLALANAQPLYRLHVINPHPQHPSITPYRRFTRRARNRATNARFRVFSPNPAPWPRVGERAAPLPPPCHLPTPTTSQHHPTPSFHTARPKPSDKRSVSGFSPNPIPPTLRWQTRGPPAATAALTCTHHLPASPHAAISHCTPETE